LEFHLFCALGNFVPYGQRFDGYSCPKNIFYIVLIFTKILTEIITSIIIMKLFFDIN